MLLVCFYGRMKGSFSWIEYPTERHLWEGIKAIGIIPIIDCLADSVFIA